MKDSNQKTPPSWYKANADIVKKYIWDNPLFGYILLQKVVKQIIDALIKRYPRNVRIPMQLMRVYDMVERHMKRYKPLVERITLYAKYSTKLYTYIERFLGKGKAHAIFEKAKDEMLLQKVPETDSPKTALNIHEDEVDLSFFNLPRYRKGSATLLMVFKGKTRMKARYPKEVVK